MDIKYYVGGVPDEKPLQNIIQGGFCSVFKCIGCIGDSLAAGEIEAKNTDGAPFGWDTCFDDLRDCSWPAYIAKHTGCEVRNFSRGGMTAKEYIESFAEANGYWEKAKGCQAYIIALGVNDILNCNRAIGSADDGFVENGENTVAGDYGEIIRRLKAITPGGVFFLVSMPRGGCWADENDAKKRAHRDLLKDMCKRYENAYLIDLFEYAPVYDEEFYRRYFLGYHMSPVGYNFTALMIESHIDFIIRKNPEKFADICFIGTDYKRQ